MTFLLATHNPGKIREMQKILSGLGIDVKENTEYNVEVEETGNTFEENALLKAKAVCEVSGLPAIADDSGLCVDVLNGGPGVYSARYGGEGLSDLDRRLLVLDSMRGQTSRAAHFACSIVCVFPNGDTITAAGRCDGTISFASIGDAGFGYDPIFFYQPKLKTFAQLTEEEKNEVSHRGKALAAFAEKLTAYLDNLQRQD